MRPVSVLQGGARRRRHRLRVPLAMVLLLALAIVGGYAVLGSHRTAREQDAAPPAAGVEGFGAAQAAPPPRPRPEESYAALPVAAARRVSATFRRPPAAGILFDIRSGRVLWQRDAGRRLRIASLTKMMTALVTVQRLPRRAKVLVTRQALAYQGSGVGVLPLGKRIDVETMLYGLLLPSGNDAAIALAQRVRGRVSSFVALMNEEGRALGLRCTRFSSVDGFRDRGNYSCARDLAVIEREVLSQPRLARIVRTRHVNLPFPGPGGRLDLYNNNPLLIQRYPGTLGVKTGFTNRAGRCLVAAVRRGGVELGVVLLRSPDPAAQARALLDRGFRALANGRR